MKKILCRILGHSWEYIGKNKNGNSLRRCKRCKYTQNQIWTGFSETMWLPTYINNKEDAIDFISK